MSSFFRNPQKFPTRKSRGVSVAEFPKSWDFGYENSIMGNF